MKLIVSTWIALFALISSASAQTWQESGGLVVMEMENTSSALDLWQKQTALAGHSGSGYLQFLGNTYETGPATSPLEYSFKINQAGLYYLHLHCAKETHDGRTDVANDCYVRVEGDYNAGPGPYTSHGDNASLPLLQSNTKYFGGATDAWKWENGQNSSGGAGNLDPGGETNKRVAVYDFKAGQTYKLVVSGRSKFFRINRIVFRHTSTAAATAQNLSTPESATTGNLVYDATADFPSIDSGQVPYYVDNGNDALAIAANVVANRTGFARASRTFDGPGGSYDVTITTLTEEDGESTYRLLVNGSVVRTFSNPYIGPGSARDLQPETHTWIRVPITQGDTLAIESNAATNGEIPETGGTAWSRGRWRQIELTPTVVNPPAGRLAIVADGNSPDPDDIGATAVLLGILKGAGLSERLVQLSHSCDLDPFQNSGTQTIDATNELRRQNKLNAVSGEGIGFFGPFPNLANYYNCRTHQADAVNNLRDAINASSASSPLWIIEAGEPDVIGYALQAANATARQHVHVVSHHPANDNSGDFFTWAQILAFGVTEHQIGDQNIGLQTAIAPWDWALNHPSPGIAWIWNQLKYAEQDGVVTFQTNKFDCSDAGMVYWWITGANSGGNKNSTPVEMGKLLPTGGTVATEFLPSRASDTNIKDDGSLVDQSVATAYVGSGGSNPVVDRCVVFVFALPDLGAVTDPFTSASLFLNYESKAGSVPNIDLYGLARRDQDAVPGGDYYGQTTAADPTAGTTRLQPNILTNATSLGQVTTSASGSSALRAYLNSQYASGAGIGKFVFLRLNTTVPKGGANRALITMSEGASGPPDLRPRIVFTANFGTTASTGTAADTFDSNNDGESNLIEFATGQAPNAATFTSTPLARSGANLEFTYTRSKAAMADGIQFAVEWSETLGTGIWSSAGVTEQILSDNGIVQTVNATVPAGTGGKRFVHLKTSR